jgi:hypothetical protein
LRASAGTVATTDKGRVVVLDDGTRLMPLWPSMVTLTDGDRVQVLLVDGTAHIIGPVVATPRPISGTIAGAASSGVIPVSVPGGTVQARYAGTAPAIGTLVGILWHGTTPFLLPGALAPIASDPQLPPPTPAPPPTGPTTGTLLVPAIGSGTWRTGGWGWASSSDVLQGGAPYVSQESRGGWWYGSAAQAIAGRTVTGARIRLGARLRVGNYNAAAVLHLWLTTNATRPGADFARIEGPFDVALAPGAGPQLITLPTTWGQAMANLGCGIAVQGSPYAGVLGVGSDPESGHVSLDWAR